MKRFYDAINFLILQESSMGRRLLPNSSDLLMSLCSNRQEEQQKGDRYSLKKTQSRIPSVWCTVACLVVMILLTPRLEPKGMVRWVRG